jgi:hypothetical protein
MTHARAASPASLAPSPNNNYLAEDLHAAFSLQRELDFLRIVRAMSLIAHAYSLITYPIKITKENSYEKSPQAKNFHCDAPDRLLHCAVACSV